MATITKPLLAGSYDPAKATFPLLATAKIDGIRFIIRDGVALSRSLKPLRNEYIQKILSDNLPDGIDGEITAGDSFQDCGAIMRIKGEPDFKIWIFDYVNPDKETIAPYQERMNELKNLEPLNIPNYEVLYPVQVDNQDQLDELAHQHLADGFEGTMVRSPEGTYKFGRSTTKEGILLKIKDFADSEAKIIGFVELERNLNEAKTNALGHTERSTSKEGKVKADTLGAFVVDWQGVQFNCGSGLNDELRQLIWQDTDAYLGKLIKFKYQPAGMKADTGVPRLPIFLGFRDEDDL